MFPKKGNTLKIVTFKSIELLVPYFPWEQPFNKKTWCGKLFALQGRSLIGAYCLAQQVSSHGTVHND